MSRGPDREPITRPVFVWLWVSALLMAHRDDTLAAEIQAAMEGWQLCEDATFALTVDEQLRVNAVLQDWLGEQDPE